MLYDKKIIDQVKEMLTLKQLTLSVAESVTSGHLQAAFSSATEASKFFQGGITAYNAGQKCRHLNIEPIAALEDNGVSEKVACEMATQVNNLFISDYGISITGYATKMPEKGIDNLYAFFAIAYKQKVVTVKKISSSKEESVDVQIDYTIRVIKEFENHLTLIK